jgi:hypothetical protein
MPQIVMMPLLDSRKAIVDVQQSGSSIGPVVGKKEQMQSTASSACTAV